MTETQWIVRLKVHNGNPAQQHVEERRVWTNKGANTAIAVAAAESKALYVVGCESCLEAPR